MTKLIYHPAYGRVMQCDGYATRIYWTDSMISYLRTHFATTLNQELADHLMLSQRTMLRKARQLGLSKDPAWLARIWDERRRMAHMASRAKGYPGGFRKGCSASPEHEFKPGHRLTPEQSERRRERMRQWYREHPDVAHRKALKAWQTRRARQAAGAESESEEIKNGHKKGPEHQDRTEGDTQQGRGERGDGRGGTQGTAV